MDTILVVEDEPRVIVDTANLGAGEIITPREQAGADDIVGDIPETADADLKHRSDATSNEFEVLLIGWRIAPDAFVRAIASEQVIKLHRSSPGLGTA